MRLRLAATLAPARQRRLLALAGQHPGATAAPSQPLPRIQPHARTTDHTPRRHGCTPATPELGAQLAQLLLDLVEPLLGLALHARQGVGWAHRAALLSAAHRRASCRPYGASRDMLLSAGPPSSTRAAHGRQAGRQAQRCTRHAGSNCCSPAHLQRHTAQLEVAQLPLHNALLRL